MNLLLNSRFTIAQRGLTFVAVAGKYTLDRWRSVTAGFSIAQGANGRKAIVTLTANGKIGILQPIESYDSIASIGDTLTAGVTVENVVGSSSVSVQLLCWSGTVDKPINSGLIGALASGWADITGAPVPSNVKNLALLIEIEGSAGDCVELDKAYVGEDAHRSYVDEWHGCSRFYQEYSTDWQANEMVAWGRTLKKPSVNTTNQAHVEFYLRYPLRARDGAIGKEDIVITGWPQMYIYGAGVSKPLIGDPELTCAHQHFLGFTATAEASAFSANHAITMRSYYATQSEINAAASSDRIKIDAELRE
jgi:hypothetical protein